MSSRGVLLVNLGSPDSTDTKDVRVYLREFLGDPRVLDIPYWQRKPLVDLIITPFRAPKSAEAYSKVWTTEGSPLIVITEKVRDLLRERIDLPVEIGMRYGNPSTEAGVKALLARGVTEIYLIPLYPHYALSSYETAVTEVKRVMKDIAPGVNLVVQPPFYDDPSYIDALVEVSKPALEKDYDHLLFSFHGVPERHVRKTDPSGCYCLNAKDCCNAKSPAHAFCYRHQCFATAWAFVAKAKIPKKKYSISFQSRLLNDPWLKPYTDFELEKLPSKNKKKLLIISPAFVSDCLETIEELGLEGREEFLKAGGKEYTLIPCLNDHPRWIDVLEGFVNNYLDGGLYHQPAEAQLH